MTIHNLNIEKIKEKLDALSNIEFAIWVIGTVIKEKGRAEVYGVKYILGILRPDVDWEAVLGAMATEGLGV